MACDCATKLQAKLDDHNTLLIVASGVDGTERAALWTERAERRRDGKKAMRVLATFCPMCGTRYSPELAKEQS